MSSVRALANQAFSRAAGTPLVEGNSVRLLKDARENYPAWLEPVESRIMLTVGALLLALAILFAKFPRVLAYPVIVVCVWIAVALLYKGYRLHRRKSSRKQRNE